MKRIVLISCVSKKLNKASSAKELYVSPLFKLNLQFARKLNPDGIYILSALYGLVSLDQIISPYDLTLNKMNTVSRKNWARKVLSQLEENVPIHSTQFIILAGEKYRQYLIPHLPYHEIPMRGLRIGEQLQYLKRQINK